MNTKYVHDHQGSSGHEAEHRHEHHPALDQGNGHQGGGDQDPYQAPKDLQGGDREYWSRDTGATDTQKGEKEGGKKYLFYLPRLQARAPISPLPLPSGLLCFIS